MLRKSTSRDLCIPILTWPAILHSERSQAHHQVRCQVTLTINECHCKKNYKKKIEGKKIMSPPSYPPPSLYTIGKKKMFAGFALSERHKNRWAGDLSCLLVVFVRRHPFLSTLDMKINNKRGFFIAQRLTFNFCFCWVGGWLGGCVAGWHGGWVSRWLGGWSNKRKWR